MLKVWLNISAPLNPYTTVELLDNTEAIVATSSACRWYVGSKLKEGKRKPSLNERKCKPSASWHVPMPVRGQESWSFATYHRYWIIEAYARNTNRRKRWEGGWFVSQSNARGHWKFFRGDRMFGQHLGKKLRVSGYILHSIFVLVKSSENTQSSRISGQGRKSSARKETKTCSYTSVMSEGYSGV